MVVRTLRREQHHVEYLSFEDASSILDYPKSALNFMLLKYMCVGRVIYAFEYKWYKGNKLYN